MLNLSPVKDWGFHSICTEIQNNYLTDCLAPFIISCSCRQLLPGHFPSPCLPKTTTLFRAGWVETSRHRTLCCRSDGDASLHFPCLLWLCVIGKASTSTVSISPKPPQPFTPPPHRHCNCDEAVHMADPSAQRWLSDVTVKIMLLQRFNRQLEAVAKSWSEQVTRQTGRWIQIDPILWLSSFNDTFGHLTTNNNIEHTYIISSNTWRQNTDFAIF